MTRTPDEASLTPLGAEFMRGADLARLLALNSALEAARVGRNGEAAARTALKTDAIIISAITSHGEAASLLSHTLEACRSQPTPGH